MARDIAAAAVGRLDRFALSRGPDALLCLYWLHTARLDYGALGQLGPMPVRDFVLGGMHRPFGDFSLAQDLALAVSLGHVGIRRRGAARLAYLRPAGAAALDTITQALEQADLPRLRRELRVASYRDQAGHMDRVRQRNEEGATYLRREFCALVPRLEVRRALELGSGSGLLGAALDAGLLGEAELVCADLSMGRLLQLRQATQGRVKTIRRSTQAVGLPTGSQCLVAGCAGPSTAGAGARLAEARRVLRPGGSLWVFAGCPRLGQAPRALQEALDGVPQRTLQRLWQPGELPRMVEDAGFLVEHSSHVRVQIAFQAADEVYDALAESGVLAELEESAPFALAERTLEEIFRRCSQAIEREKALTLPVDLDLVLAGSGGG